MERRIQADPISYIVDAIDERKQETIADVLACIDQCHGESVDAVTAKAAWEKMGSLQRVT